MEDMTTGFFPPTYLLIMCVLGAGSRSGVLNILAPSPSIEVRGKLWKSVVRSLMFYHVVSGVELRSSGLTGSKHLYP